MNTIQRCVVDEARLWIGTPYCHQASVRGAGADCLGLLRGVWRAVIGPEPEAMPAYSRDWSEASGEERLLLAARRWLAEPPGDAPDSGDVLLFRMRDGSVAKHLGIVGRVGSEPSLIHAYSGHGVVESPLSAAWTRRIAGRFRFPVGTN